MSRRARIDASELLPRLCDNVHEIPFAAGRPRLAEQPGPPREASISTSICDPSEQATNVEATARHRLVVLGRQGAGKSTQCPLLADALHVVHLSTGDLLRDSVRARTALGREVARYIDVGELVPDALIVDVVLDRLGRSDVRQRGYVLDGFPRTVGQAEALLHHDPDLDAVIDLHVPVDVVVERVSGRRACPGCGWVTSVDAAIESVPCGKCDGVAVRRQDDSAHAIRRRLALYDEETRPVAAWFAARGLLLEVDGLAERDEVFARILAALQPQLERSAAGRTA